MKLSTRSLAELKMIANEKGIPVDGLKKAQIVEALEAQGENVITSQSVSPSGGPSTESAGTNSNGVFISPQPEKIKAKREAVFRPDPEDTTGKVAVYALRNLSWTGVGKLSNGYNFVTREEADKWITHKAVREATPDEVASHFGVK